MIDLSNLLAALADPARLAALPLLWDGEENRLSAPAPCWLVGAKIKYPANEMRFAPLLPCMDYHAAK